MHSFFHFFLFSLFLHDLLFWWLRFCVFCKYIYIRLSIGAAHISTSHHKIVNNLSTIRTRCFFFVRCCHSIPSCVCNGVNVSFDHSVFAARLLTVTSRTVLASHVNVTMHTHHSNLKFCNWKCRDAFQMRHAKNVHVLFDWFLFDFFFLILDANISTDYNKKQNNNNADLIDGFQIKRQAGSYLPLEFASFEKNANKRRCRRRRRW